MSLWRVRSVYSPSVILCAKLADIESFSFSNSVLIFLPLRPPPNFILRGLMKMITQLYLSLPGLFTLALIFCLPNLIMLQALLVRRRCRRAGASLSHCLKEIPVLFIGLIADTDTLHALYTKYFQVEPSVAELTAGSVEYICLVDLFVLLLHPRMRARIHHGTVRKATLAPDAQAIQYCDEPLIWLEYTYRGRRYVSYYQGYQLATCEHTEFVYHVRIVNDSSCRADELIQEIVKIIANLPDDSTCST